MIHGPSGQRTVAVRDLQTGPFGTVLEAAELLVEIRLPIRPGAGSAYTKVERRAGDYAVAAAGAIVWLDGDTVSEVGIGLAAVGAPHSVATATEDAIRGRAADEATIEVAGEQASAECNPFSDQRGPADYKRALVGELVKRSLRTAIARARGQEA